MKRFWIERRGKGRPHEALGLRAVEALLLHAGSSLLGAVEGVWLTRDLWFVRTLGPSEDIPVAVGSVGPPGTVSMVSLVLSPAATLYAGIVLALWVRSGRHQKALGGRGGGRFVLAAAWAGIVVMTTIPSHFIRGDVLDSAIAAFRASYWQAATSIGMGIADLCLAAMVASRTGRSEQPNS